MQRYPASTVFSQLCSPLLRHKCPLDTDIFPALPLQVEEFVQYSGHADQTGCAPPYHQNSQCDCWSEVWHAMAHAIQGFLPCVVACQLIMPMHRRKADTRCVQAELCHLLYITRAAGARAACIALPSSLSLGSAAMAVIRASAGQLAADGCNSGRALASSPSDRNRALMPSSFKPTSRHLQQHPHADHIGFLLSQDLDACCPMCCMPFVHRCS